MERGGQIDAVQNGRLRIEKARNRMIVNDGSTDILLAGERLDGVIAVELARLGFDVKTASDDDLVFSSRFNLFKIIDSDVVTLTTPNLVNGTTQTVSESVPHTLGYSPLVIAFGAASSQQVPGETYTSPFGGSKVQVGTVGTTSMTINYMQNEEVVASTTDITFALSVSNSTGLTMPPLTVDVKYFILAETAP